MSSEKLLFKVPHDFGHTHFYDTIESFPGLQAGPTFEDREKYIRETIRHQLLTTTPDQAKRRTSPLTQWLTCGNASTSANDPRSSSACRRKCRAPP